MTPDEIKELISILAAKNITEFELDSDDVKLRIKCAPAVLTSAVAASYQKPVAAPIPSPLPIPSAQPASAPEKDASIHIIKSPMVATFYEASAPGLPAFVKEGDTVAVGQVLCILTAVKLMNEFTSDVAGRIEKILVSNAQPVEYGQPLFQIRKM